MKPSQILLGFISVLIFVTIALATVTSSPNQLLAQPPIAPSIAEPPSIGPMPPTQNTSAPTFPQELDANDNKSFLPIIQTADCVLNSNENTLASLIINDPNQKRNSMSCSIILAEVARQRAQDMGNRNYCSHVNPDGYGPNFLVAQAGYTLPSEWDTSPVTLNYIESIACGHQTAQLAFDNWMDSSGHKAHVLGQDDDGFWKRQTNYGVGYAYVPDSNSDNFEHFWVFISAPPQ